MRHLAIILLAVLLGVLAGCSSTPRRASQPAGTETAVQLERTRALAQVSQWSASGRIAISDGKDGGSGRLEWHQNGPDFQVSLSAPVTRRSWRLSGSQTWARLEGLEGGPFEGFDADALLFEHLGWDVPVAGLVDWVRGLPAGREGQVQYQDSGLPAVIEQHGWHIEYRDWLQVDGLMMPKRVFATRGNRRLRLQIDAWTLTRP